MYIDKQLIFQGLLDKDRSLLIHSHNLQTLAIEIFKVTKGLAADKFANIFKT